jgi:hypothetical protein
MLAGKLTFFEGADKITRLAARLGLSNSDPDIEPFALITSETDHLPLPNAQHNWSAEALSKLQDEFRQTELWAQPLAVPACERLIRRFENV